MRISLPPQVARIYESVNELENTYPGRKFTPDGHLVGSIGEVIAAEMFNLELLPPSTPIHDAKDSSGRFVQIKLTSIKSISMNSNCDRLIVMRIISPDTAEVVYNGDGGPVWKSAGKMQKNGQCRVSFAKMRSLDGWIAK